MTAFLLATGAGLLGLNTAWYKGPLVDRFGGRGLGFIISAVVAVISYVAFFIIYPENDSDYASGRSRLKRTEMGRGGTAGGDPCVGCSAFCRATMAVASESFVTHSSATASGLR